MFDKLENLLIRFEELLGELGQPDVAGNPEHFQKLRSRAICSQWWIRIRNIKSADRQRRTVCLCWKKNQMKKCGKC